MRKINPIYLLIAFNILLFVLRAWIPPDGGIDRFSAGLETALEELGVVGYLAVLGIYALCSFLFIPLLIPLNILCGALYGPVVGTAISIVGITLGCFVSTISVRHVFTGMQKVVAKRPSAQKILAQVARHGDVAVIFVRLAFIVPYLIQNIVLALTSINVYRIALLTFVGSLPGAAIYSFLGAGLVRADSTNEFAVYLAVPLVLLIAITVAMRYFNSKYQPE